MGRLRAVYCPSGRAREYAPLAQLAEVTRGSKPSAALRRRYAGKTPGKYIDIEGPHAIRRSRPGAAVVTIIEGATYTIAMRPLLEVVHSRASTAIVSRVITDASQLTDASGRQATLGGGW